MLYRWFAVAGAHSQPLAINLDNQISARATLSYAQPTAINRLGPRDIAAVYYFILDLH